MSEEREIKFLGSFAQIMSAIRIGPEITRLTIDVPEMEQHNAIGLQALLKEPLEFTVKRYNGKKAEQQKGKSKKAPSGPFSAYWSRMFAKGFNNYPALIETLDCAGDQIRLRLHDMFKVETCSDISPAEFEAWMKSEGEELFASLITLSRQAQAWVSEKAA